MYYNKYFTENLGTYCLIFCPWSKLYWNMSYLAIFTSTSILQKILGPIASFFVPYVNCTEHILSCNMYYRKYFTENLGTYCLLFFPRFKLYWNKSYLAIRTTTSILQKIWGLIASFFVPYVNYIETCAILQYILQQEFYRKFGDLLPHLLSLI